MGENWNFQLSIKVEGQHLLNLRSEDSVGLKDALTWAVENREAILAACAALEGARKPEPARPALTPGPRAIVAPGPSGRETGPIHLESVETKPGKFGGTAYTIRWEGQVASTFDELIGKAAMGFYQQGHPCFITLAPAKNPRFTNVVSIRMAA